MTTQNQIVIVKQLFPSLASAKIEQRKATCNGMPFFIQQGEVKYWLKIINSARLEDTLKDVEKQALQEIKSPNVVELLDVKTKLIGGQRYDGLLFAYIDGEDLGTIYNRRKVQKQPFTEAEAKQLLQDVVAGIKAISEKGWVHQDIKKQNIRFDQKNNRYVILDLGLAYYSKDFQLPNGKYNRDYASAEQVKASVDNDKVPFITFRSDIAQLGQMVYELLTLKNPFKDEGQNKLNLQRITKGEYVPITDLNNNISPELAAVITTMLDPHPGSRYRSIDELISILNGKSYSEASRFAKGIYFQVWKGPHGYKENIAQAENEIEGVVVSASQMPGRELIDKVKEKNLKLIFDPETFLLTEGIHNSWQGGLSNWEEWYDFPLDPSKFRSKTKIADFVAQIVQSQIDLETDYIVPPYFCIHNPDSEWRNLNGLFYHECVQYCRRIALDKPVICPIAVSQAVITVDRSRKELVDYYSQLPDLEVFFLRIDAKEQNTTVPVIQAVSQLITELEYHKPVLLANAGTVVFGYFSKGLSACITSLVDSQRENDLSAKQSVKHKGGGGFKEKFFIPALLQFVKVEGDLPTLIDQLGIDVLCECEVCQKAKVDKQSASGKTATQLMSNWSKASRGNHFFSYLSEWREKLQSLTPEQRMDGYKQIIDKARAIYASNRNEIVFTQIIKREDAANWEVAFFSK